MCYNNTQNPKSKYDVEQSLQRQEQHPHTEDALLQKHPSPKIYRHAYESDRIRTDSAAQIRHDVPVDGAVPPECGWWEQRWPSQQEVLRYFKRTLPFQQCSNEYSLATFQKDFVAGCTSAIMAIPLSMSYAKLAGLPAYYGLYANFVAPLVYPVFGTSRQLLVGPAALMSLLLSAGLSVVLDKEGLAETDVGYMERYTQLAIQTSVLVGLVNLGMGLLRLGFVTQFLSRALISGFTSGSAVLIAFSQVKHLFGYDVKSSDRLYVLIQNLAKDISRFNWKTCIMGLSSIAVLFFLKKTSEKYPRIKWVRAWGPFFVSAGTIILTIGLDLNQHGIPVVGRIPQGLPSVSVKQWTPLSSELWTMVLAIVIIGFVQSYSVAKQLANKHGYEINSSQELISLGFVNLVGGMFQCFPTTGALAPSAINDELGAQTAIASVVTAVVILFVLLFLTPVFEKLPLNTLAAIVISFVLGMFDYEEALHLYKVHKFDFTVWMVAFVGTMFLGIKVGLGISVIVSLLIVIYESANPHIAVLGRLAGTSMYRNVEQYPDVERYDGLVIVRIDGPMYFANAENIRDKITKCKCSAAEELKERGAGEVKYILLNLTPVSHIDTTALHVLEDMYLTEKRLGVQICFCNPDIVIMANMVKSGLAEVVGRQHIFSAVIDAVHWCLQDRDDIASEGSHGLTTEMPHDKESELTDDIEIPMSAAVLPIEEKD